MVALDAAFWAVCLVLVASGATKLADPAHFAATVAALRSSNARPSAASSGDVLARTVGAAEVLVGLWGLAAGGRVVAAVITAMYLGFAVVVVAARRRGLSTCGCFGARSGAPSRLHVVLNLVSAAVACVAAVTSPTAVAEVVDERGAAGAWWALAALAAAVAIVAVQTSRRVGERGAG